MPGWNYNISTAAEWGGGEKSEKVEGGKISALPPSEKRKWKNPENESEEWNKTIN